jgi:hypothetical protein
MGKRGHGRLSFGSDTAPEYPKPASWASKTLDMKTKLMRSPQRGEIGEQASSMSTGGLLFVLHCKRVCHFDWLYPRVELLGGEQAEF